MNKIIFARDRCDLFKLSFSQESITNKDYVVGISTGEAILPLTVHHY